MRWSGEMPWAEQTESLTEGSHEIRFVYDKDRETTRGEDTAEVDNIWLVRRGVECP